MRKNKHLIVPYIFIAPTLLVTIVLLFYPMLVVFRNSFYDFRGAASSNKIYVGFGNYGKLIQDRVFIESLWTSLKWVLSTVAIEFLLGFILALLLNRTFRGRSAIRTVMISPYAISAILTSSMFFLIYNQHVGVLNDILKKFGIIEKGISWLGDYAFTSVVFAEAWNGLPFFIIILTAVLQTIPNELYEAAKVDGTNVVQRFFTITVPMISRTLLFSCLLRSVWEYNNIDVIYALTSGGPVNMTTTSAMYMVRTTIKGNNFGYGSAIAVASFIVLVLCSALVLLAARNIRREQE